MGPSFINTRVTENSNNETNINTSTDNRVNNSISTKYIDIIYGTKLTNIYPTPAAGEPVRKVHFMVPFSKNAGYIGNSRTLELVDEKIKAHDFSHHRVALCGMGGIGYVIL